MNDILLKSIVMIITGMVIAGTSVLIVNTFFLDSTPTEPTGSATSSVVPGEDIPSPVGYVNDFADVMTPDLKASLETKLSTFVKEGHGEMTVLTVKSLNGLSIEEFGIRVGEKWQVGSASKDDGIIVIISTGDRKVRIEVGRGAEITDAQAANVLSTVMVPKLKNSDWNGAISDGVDALIKLMNNNK